MSEGNPTERSAPFEDFEEIGEPIGHECGVYGVYAPGEPVATITHGALHDLQHRGQSGAGLFVQSERLGALGHKGNGLVDAAVSEVTRQGTSGFSIIDDITRSPVAIGHTRYSTSPENDASQPFKGDKSGIVVAHNGHIEGGLLLAASYGFDPTNIVSDSHALTLVLDKQTEALGSLEAALHDVLPRVEGAYCLTIMDGKRLIAARDPWGFHPLSLGEMPDSRGYVVASEDVAFESAQATFVRDIEPGEIVSIDEDGIRSSYLTRKEPAKACMYEYVYMARPDSTINGANVFQVRKYMGESLAKDHPADVDVVVGVPSSGLAAAAGYAQASGLPIVEGILKNAYASRSFIERADSRERVLRRKLRPNKPELDGKRIVLVDDSLIKGNTMRSIVGLLREAGASEIHVRLAAPPYKNPCYMGMDTGDPEKLIARHLTPEQIALYIGADSVAFNSVERVEEAVGRARKEGIGSAVGSLCTACTTGEYPFKPFQEVRTVTLGMPAMRKAVERPLPAIVKV